MKFSHGAWLWAKGVTPATIKKVQEYSVEPDSVRLAGLDRVGDKFEGLVLEARLTSPMADVVRVNITHHRPAERGVTRLDLDYSLAADGVTTLDEADRVSFTSGRVTVRVAKTSWALEFIDNQNGSTITGGAENSLGYMTVPGRGNFIMQRLSLGVGESIYGLGERFGPLVKNGQSVPVWNEDGGTSSDLAYKNIPFYLSSRGYGLLINSPGKAEFEIATERVSQIQFAMPGESLDYYLFFGPALKAVLDKYTRLSGRPAVPPAWSFGLWLSTSFTTTYDEKTVTEFVEGMASRDLPLKVFHFDCFWMRERHWCDFEWDSRAFPDPVGMLKRLKARGLRVCLWINPYISQLSKIFAEGRDGGFFIRKTDGSVYQRDAWQCGMALIDFTNPAAVDWYLGKLQGLLDMGVDTFKTDFGELIPHEDVQYHDGSDPSLMHNHYAYLYNQAVFGLLERHHGVGNAMVFARSAAGGSQKFPVHWGGDCDATFEAMAEDLRGGLSFCLSGPAFWSHDIGGFNGTANAGIYKRWVAFGLLSTHSRLHGSGSYRVPWLFDEESVDVMRIFTKLKNRLFPYLFAAAHDANEHGWPLMRAMVLEFPNDPACRHLDRQYMLGSSLMVAPVFREDSVAEYYLPAGTWTDLLTGKAFEGGRWRSDKVDFKHLPLLVRENTMLAMSDHESEPAWGTRDPLTLHLFAISNGTDVSVRLVPSPGEGVVRFRCRREGSQLTLESNGRAADVQVLVHGVHRGDGLGNGKTVRESADGLLVKWLDTAKPLTVTSTD